MNGITPPPDDSSIETSEREACDVPLASVRTAGPVRMPQAELIALVSRYAEACDELGTDLFKQTAEQSAALHQAAAAIHARIELAVADLYARAEAPPAPVLTDREIAAEYERLFSADTMETYPQPDGWFKRGVRWAEAKQGAAA